MYEWRGARTARCMHLFLCNNNTHTCTYILIQQLFTHAYIQKGSPRLYLGSSSRMMDGNLYRRPCSLLIIVGCMIHFLLLSSWRHVVCVSNLLVCRLMYHYLLYSLPVPCAVRSSVPNALRKDTWHIRMLFAASSSFSKCIEPARPPDNKRNDRNPDPTIHHGRQKNNDNWFWSRWRSWW